MEHAQIDNPRVTLVIGGARSGKSRHAERLIAAHPPPWTYIATAEAWDDEMRARIAEHRSRRRADWITRETPVELAAALAETEAVPALVDCLTLWLTNLLLGGHDFSAATAALEVVLRARAAPTVIVTNEVGQGIVPDNALARTFRDAAGVLNQRVAALSGHVTLMVAGIAMTVKEPR
jgi:adenosyl cobinamide kinase/adenosyl cobinamide phosphate guanylyltransferase